MPFDIHVITVGELVRTQVSGEYDFSAALRVIEELGAVCAHTPCHHVLLDVRQASTPTLSPTDIYNLVMCLHNVGVGTGNRVAILYRPRADVDRAKLFEM